jgi:hypothetical protein
VEFVKHFRAHLGEIVAFDVSFEGSLLCTAAKDKVGYFFYHIGGKNIRCDEF